MADIFFTKVPVINKMILEMILITPSVLLPRIFSADEVIYFEK